MRVKQQNTQKKEKVIKREREERVHIRNYNQTKATFSRTTGNSEESPSAKTKSYQPKIVHLESLCFKNERKLRSFQTNKN